MIKEPKLVFSFNSYPILKNKSSFNSKFYDTIYMTSLSVLYASECYENIELYVDGFAYPFLKILPCKVTLLEFEKNAEIWMKSKIRVIEEQTEPFIHVDNDVFFKSKIDLVFSNIIVERIDVTKNNYSLLRSFFERYSDELPFWNSDLKMIPSCGVLGFSDMELKSTFVKTFKAYEGVLNAQRKAYNIFMKDIMKIKSYPEVCLLLEQYSLGCMLEHENIEFKLLLSGNSKSEQIKEANKLNYTHLYGNSKYNSRTKKRIHYLFENQFNDYYKLLVKKIALAKVS